MEIKEGLMGAFYLLPSILFGVLSMLGGRDQLSLGIRPRIWKRVIAPCIFMLTICYIKFNWWFLICFPLYWASTGPLVSYGSDSEKLYKKLFPRFGETWIKILSRTVWSLIRTMSSIPIAVITGTWLLFVMQLMIGLVTTVGLGVWNKRLKAPVEELLINNLSVFLVPFMV